MAVVDLHPARPEVVLTETAVHAGGQDRGPVGHEDARDRVAEVGEGLVLLVGVVC